MSAPRVNSGTSETKRPPEGGLSAALIEAGGSGYVKCWSILLPAIGHEAHAHEAQDHHGPGGGLRDSAGEAATDWC
jgi:hypothetical protein